MGLTAKKTGRIFTFADYRSWTDEERWEIINGEAYAMTPAPSLKHQEVVSNFHIRLKTDPQNRSYTAISPTDVGEYLLVYPEDEMVERYRLVNGQYLSADVFNWDETLKLVALPDITINLWEIFARQRPQENGAI